MPDGYASLAQAPHQIWARRPTISHWPHFCPLTFRKYREIAENCDVRGDVRGDVNAVGGTRTRKVSPDTEANEYDSCWTMEKVGFQLVYKPLTSYLT